MATWQEATESTIAGNAITNAKLADAAVGTSKLADGAVTGQTDGTSLLPSWLQV
ncbi:MAG: hypothetical protein QM664_05435 [Flavihumibacter sp.]